MTKIFTDENFQKEVIEISSQKPVLIDFFAVWCGPCKMQGPIIDDVASLMGDKAVVGKLNTDDSQATAIKFGVMSIPTLMIFKDGSVKETMVGMQPKDKLIELLKKYF